MPRSPDGTCNAVTGLCSVAVACIVEIGILSFGIVLICMFIKFGSIDLSGTPMMGLPERQFLPI